MFTSIANALKDIADAINKSPSIFAMVWNYAKDVILVVSIIIGIVKILHEIRQSNNSKRLESNKKEIEKIMNHLNTFFGPFRALRQESRLIYSKFALKPKKEFEKSNDPKYINKNWRTLRYLSEGNTFDRQDNAFLKEILRIGKKQLILIENNGWITERTSISDLLGKLAAHIRVLILASKRNTVGMACDLESIVFPKEVDGAIESEIRRLQERLYMLQNDKERKRIKRVSYKLHRSIEFYNKYSKEYYIKTKQIIINEIYDRFIKFLNMGDSILDAGCGVGRDTCYFIKQGMKVVSFDASIEMVKICNKYPYAYCIQKYFHEIDYIEEFDGIWANASLVHLDEKELEEALVRLVAAVKSGKYIYFSVKQFANDNKPKRNFYKEGFKTFYIHKNKSIEDIMTKKLKCKKIDCWTNKPKGEETINDTYETEFINYIFMKNSLKKEDQ